MATGFLHHIITQAMNTNIPSNSQTDVDKTTFIVEIVLKYLPCCRPLYWERVPLIAPNSCGIQFLLQTWILFHFVFSLSKMKEFLSIIFKITLQTSIINRTSTQNRQVNSQLGTWWPKMRIESQTIWEIWQCKFEICRRANWKETCFSWFPALPCYQCVYKNWY